jgi:hypothetical protein
MHERRASPLPQPASDDIWMQNRLPDKPFSFWRQQGFREFDAFAMGCVDDTLA